MKNKSIILLYILLFVTFSLFQINEFASINEKRDLEVTKQTNGILEKIIKMVKQIFKIGDESIENTVQDKNKTSTRIMQESELFQGDIILDSYQAEEIIDQVVEEVESAGIDVSEITGETQRRKKRKMSGNMTLPWEFPIPYFVEDGINDTLVMIAIKLIELETCITFKREYNLNLYKAGLRFFPGKGCSSYIGRKFPNQFQDISIGEKCETIGTIQHETMHALGVYHEQARADRDNFLKIFLENVDEENLHNFLKVEPSTSITYGTQYDYGSVMQYPTDAFSKNNQPTMIPIEKPYAKTIGTNYRMTFVDTKLLNFYYCKNRCQNEISCANNGYPDPNDCTKCKCPAGFLGNNCNELPQKSPHCGETVHHISNRKKYLYIYGGKNCIHHLIAAESSKRLKISFTFLNYYPGFESRCNFDNSLEVKYMADKTVTGALLCLNDSTTTITSQNYFVVVYHRSTNTNNGATLIAESIDY